MRFPPGLLRRGMLTMAVFMMVMLGLGPTAAAAGSYFGADEAPSSAPTSAPVGSLLGDLTATTDRSGDLTDPRQPAVGAAVPTFRVGMDVVDSGGNPNADTATRGICQKPNTGQYDSNLELLPVQRWKGATDFHTRLGTTDIGDRVMRDGVMSLAMNLGNTAWSMSTGLVQYAVAFCPLERAGGVADKTFHDLAEAVRDSMILTALLFFTTIAYLIRLAKTSLGGASVRQLLGGNGENGAVMASFFKKGISIALLVIMVNGAGNSTGGQMDEDTRPYNPGMGSPGWFVVTVDQVTTDLTSTVVSAVPFKTDEEEEAENSDFYDYSCAAYLDAMDEGYRDNFYVSGMNYKRASALPRALNEFWETTGLEAWKNAQFGADNPHGEYMYCRMLETNIDATVDIEDGRVDSPSDGTIEGLMNGKANDVGALDENAMAWRGSGVNTYRDRIYVGWALCRHEGGKSYEGWAPLREAQGLIPANDGWDPPGITSISPLGYVVGEVMDVADGGGTVDTEAIRDACTGMFADNNNDPNGNDSERDGSEDTNNLEAFDWPSGGGGMDGAGLGQVDKEFLKNLHGVSVSDGLITVFIFLISSVLMLIVFGLFALAIIFAKILALVMIVGVLIALLASLMPSSDLSKVTQYGKQYIGISIFAFSAVLLLSILTLFTRILVDIGNDTLPGGRGGVMSMMWTGVAPVVALMAIHYMFKKANVPSPMSPGAASAWGKQAASGGLGTAAAAGVGAGVGSALTNRWGSAAKAKAGQGIKNTISRNPGDKTQATTNGQGKMGLKGEDDTAATAGTGNGPSASSGGSGKATALKPGDLKEGESLPEKAAAIQAERKAKDEESLEAGHSKVSQERLERERRNQEAAEAKKWAQGDEGKGAVKGLKENRSLKPQDRFKKSFNAAVEKFKEKPLKTTATGLGLAAIAATGGSGALLVGGALAARTAARSTLRDGGYVRDAAARATNKVGSAITRRPDAIQLEAYRRQQLKQRESDERVLAAQAQVERDRSRAAAHAANSESPQSAAPPVMTALPSDGLPDAGEGNPQPRRFGY